MDSAEVIISELKCLDQWMKSNKININSYETKFMLFSHSKKHFATIKIGNIICIVKYKFQHLDKRLSKIM